MKRSIATVIIVVAVTVACIVALTLWRGTGSGLALADVLTQIQQVNAYMYQMSMTVTDATFGDEPMNVKTHTTALISEEWGMKMTTEADEVTPDAQSTAPISQEMYVLARQNKAITIMHGQKKYMEIDFNDVAFEETRKENSDPRAMVEEILACDYVSLGRSTVDGIEVEGFQTTDPNYIGGAGQVDVRIWVDVKTQLPVRSEIDVEMGKAMGLGEEMHMQMVLHDFQWDVSVDASEFEPVIPDDYTTLADGPIKMPAMNEETALEGLRLFADSSGAYPEKLDLMTLLSQASDLATKDMPSMRELVEQGKEVDVDARTQAMIEAMMPIQGLGMFYMLLTQEQKDPAYYGDIVTPEDEDQVLMRWKVSETEYRVIFGSLHAETVTADVLAELEKTLPEQ